jgi:hypothetical protein
VKQWEVGLKIDLGETTLTTVVPVRAPDQVDAVQAAIALVVSGIRIMGTVES